MTAMDVPGRDAPFRSPSGLLTRGAWEAELEASYDELPRWYWSAAERERQFARWVHAEAKTLATRLDRMLRPDTDPAMAAHLRAVSDALWDDAEWARRRIDGRGDEAA